MEQMGPRSQTAIPMQPMRQWSQPARSMQPTGPWGQTHIPMQPMGPGSQTAITMQPVGILGQTDIPMQPMGPGSQSQPLGHQMLQQAQHVHHIRSPGNQYMVRDETSPVPLDKGIIQNIFILIYIYIMAPYILYIVICSLFFKALKQTCYIFIDITIGDEIFQ